MATDSANSDKLLQRIRSRSRDSNTLPPPVPAPPPEAPAEKSNEGRSRLGIAVFVFVGTFLGSLLGVFADFNEALGTFELVQNAFSPKLCIVGSNTILGDGIGMAADWTEAFEAEHDASLDVRGIGSVSGIQEAIDGGCVNVLAMSEPMTDDQYTRLTGSGVTIDCATEIGYDVIAFVTDINNTTASLRTGQIISILRGGIDNWRSVGQYVRPIYILARSGSGTTEYVLMNLAYYTPTEEDPFPPDAPYYECDSNSDCLDMTLATRGSIYWVSTAWMRTQPTEYLRVIPILQGDERPLNPLHDDVNLEDYHSALVRPLYMYVLSGPDTDPAMTELAREYLRYVRSVDGQQVLEDHYFYNHFSKPATIPVDLPDGFFTENDGPRQICRQTP
jgi:ABC-type phosphate transport system substrate-binding protein